MLKLLIGRAGSGKTGAVLRSISQNTKERRRSVYIVPEQYSHDAERELAAFCPPDVSLYAEVLSFTRLASRIAQEIGGVADKLLDKGGRTLCMSLAVTEASPMLKVYSFGSNKTDFLKSLIDAYDELRSARIDLLRFSNAAGGVEPGFGKKLNDLALIFESYERIKEKSGLDPRDKLDILGASIEKSEFFDGAEVFIDGFTDFTAQEKRVLDELLRKDCDMTVSLTTPGLNCTDAAFSLPAGTARELMSMAAERGVKCVVTLIKPERDTRAPELRYLESGLYDYSASEYSGNCRAISVYSAGSAAEELSFAASECIRLAKGGARWRDIAVVSPDWSAYEPIAGGIFEKFSVPVNVGQRSDIVSKPVIAFVTGALELMTSSWDHGSVFRYVKTGLAGADPDDIDLIENYVIRWGIRGYGAWCGGSEWKMHPEGYSETMTEGDRLKLKRINAIRAAVASPLRALYEGLSKADTAIGKCRSLYDFFTLSALYDKLNAKTEELYERGENRLADEYSQLWEVILRAMEQFSDILGETPMETDEFIRLFRLILSQYDISTIPSSLDAVGIGDMRRIRGRGIKHLILIGATDTAMPKLSAGGDIFSEKEREELRKAGIELPNGDDEAMQREFGSIYTSLTMPDKSLTLSYPVYARRSYILTRIMKLMGIGEKTVSDDIYLESENAVYELAASPILDGESAKLARAYYATDPEKSRELDSLIEAAKMPRGQLSQLTAERLYSKNISLSASKLDKFYSCRFAYFLKYGLKLKKREESGLDAPESGTFVHYILENIARDVASEGGYKAVTDERIAELAEYYSAEYAEKRLGGLEEKSGRFRYLFARLCEDAKRIAVSTAEELRKSDFSPLDFELSFARDGDLPEVRVEGERGPVIVKGVVDRVDGYLRDGKLYLRVVDYKTGKKVFKLGDVVNGMNLQMLIYLFALKNEGKLRYNEEIVPSGVLYVPARDPVTVIERGDSEAEIAKKKLKNTKRTGLILADPLIVEAMENGDKKEYIPVKISKDGEPVGDSLVTLEELGEISSHVDKLIAAMGDEIRAGSVKADPYYRGSRETACLYCDYFGVCHFDEKTEKGNIRFISTLKKPDAMERIRKGKR